jgi:hypothetical protein
MATFHGACIAPPGARKRCEQCPGRWVDSNGLERTCECPHHDGGN